MLKEKRSTRIGAALIIFAIVLRLATGVLENGVLALQGGEREPDLILPTTGGAWQETLTVTEPTAPAPERLVITAEALSLVQVRYGTDCAYRPDLQALLLQPLDWDLSGDAPTVLILHTHASESYTRQPGQAYEETADYRTLDMQYNMVAVGDLLTQLLTEAGICVIHDRQIHDYPSYTASYENARAAAQDYLAQYPTIQVVLDLHRDAALNADGSQYATTATVDGQPAAQLMLVVGTDASGNRHPAWQENLAVALKLQVLLEQEAPGITRQTILRAQRFNHDLAQGAMIVEVGTAGNTQSEALRAIPVLARALVRLIHGANT